MKILDNENLDIFDKQRSIYLLTNGKVTFMQYITNKLLSFCGLRSHEYNTEIKFYDH